MSAGKSIRLFLVDGTPAGLLTAEIPNWTGHLLVAPRNRLVEALARDEASKTGVYFLVGEENARQRVYVGEGDCIADRVRQHARDPEKEFWERVCFVTSKDFNLTKAHVRFLESHLVRLVKEGNRAELANSNEPSAGRLPESDRSDMEFFITQLQILVPSVGFDFLRPRLPTSYVDPDATTPDVQRNPETTVRKSLLLRQKGVDARAIESDGEIIVLKGSIGTGQKFAVNGYGHLREALIRSGKIQEKMDGSILFMEDVPFASPSAAAAVLVNRQAAGPRMWVVEASGQTLKDWRESQLALSPTSCTPRHGSDETVAS